MKKRTRLISESAELQTAWWALSSVLSRFPGSDFQGAYQGSKDWKRCVNMLHLFRCERLLALGKAGWRRWSNKSKSYLLDCPSVFVCTRQRRRACKQLICPYCWCRAGPISVVERLATLQQPHGLGLLCITISGSVTGLEQPASGLQQATAGHRLLVQFFKPLGGLFLVSHLLPASVEDSQVRHSLVSVVPRSLANAEFDMNLSVCGFAKGSSGQITQLPNLYEPDSIWPAIGHTLAYPAELLTADPVDVLNVLSQREGSRGKAPRLRTTTGLFRG